ncbi:hypothetical protein EVAR_96440_1 [Eumeta japonica]|uniref:Uncharacterized protein n=1 Tax=Eumeta variegata TaxID=151549 RepID=A0A4C1VW14_EUMVA|nr:hypothetical protein EVAR_96440_1 [Eumeta japonica]
MSMFPKSRRRIIIVSEIWRTGLGSESIAIGTGTENGTESKSSTGPDSESGVKPGPELELTARSTDRKMKELILRLCVRRRRWNLIIMKPDIDNKQEISKVSV